MKSQFLINSSKFVNLTVQEIQAKLDANTDELLECDKCGNYAKADELKLQIQQLKKELNEKKLNDMVQNQKKEKKNLEKANEAEVTQFDEFWNKKIHEFNC